MKNQNLVKRDYADKEKQKLFKDVYTRTPYRQESLAEKIIGGVAFVAFVVAVVFIWKGNHEHRS